MPMLEGIVLRSAFQARKRALVKTLCYRLFMLLITVTVTWIVIGDLGDAVNIGLTVNVLKTGTYYLYERVWDHITWGLPSVT